MNVILVTGGMGFIGSYVVRRLLETTDAIVVNIDSLTYAASPQSLGSWLKNRRHVHLQIDICDYPAVRDAFVRWEPSHVMHLAAETHVDRSIDGPADFVRTNVIGTQILLEAALEYWRTLKGDACVDFRLHHVSTDEVFGALGVGDPPFDETSRYDPRSPYSATKAAADHLVRAWHHTYGLPALISNTTNNYGPWQFPEKLIPLMTLNALEGKLLRVYGDGSNIRDWIHVEDHAEALCLAMVRGTPGATYCFGSCQERTNIQVVRAICETLDNLVPDKCGPRERLIRFVIDRPGHDFRYAMAPLIAERELGWTATYDFERGLEQTIRWYMDNESWWRPIRDGLYGGQRLGMKGGARL
jgi:dTDP-glucose 4,6-dehydratase